MNALVKPQMHLIPAAMACALALASPSSAWADESIDQTLDMAVDGLVEVENVAGRIDFATWDQDKVRVRAKASDDVEKVEIRPTSGGVEIRVRNKKGERHPKGADLQLTIPSQASIDVDSVSADVKVTDSHGASISIDTVSGDVKVQSHSQRLELQSISGDIDFEGAATRSSFESVSGDIVVAGVTGEVSVSTVSGDFSLDTSELSRGRFESVSGDLTLVLRLADEGRLTCDSMSGDVTLRLPSDQKAEFTAQSFSGSIRTDFGKANRESKGPGVFLEHREGDNGARIRLESFSGDLAIRRQ